MVNELPQNIRWDSLLCEERNKNKTSIHVIEKQKGNYKKLEYLTTGMGVS